MGTAANNAAHPRDPACARYASFGGFESAVAREREGGKPGVQGN